MSTDTYVIESVAVAADKTAAPTRVNYGQMMDWDAVGLGAWSKVGFEFNEDEFAFTMADNGHIKIKAPRQPVASKHIFNAYAIEAFDVTAYEVGKKVYDYATNGVYDEATGAYDFTTTHTNKAMCLEIGGVGLLYFPSVMVTFEPPAAGVWTLAKQKGQVLVCGTDDVPAGFRWFQLLEA